MEELIKKYDFKLSWESDGIKVYNNNDLCLYYSSDDKINIKVDYKSTFNKWSDAIFKKEFERIDGGGIKTVATAIDFLTEFKSKAIIELIDENGFKVYKLDFELLESLYQKEGA